MSPVLLLALGLITAAVGGGGGAAIVVKWLNRPMDAASIRTSDTNNLRGIISELRQDKAEQKQRIDELENRLERLEDRERHALTRAAVHEAWDQMAFAMLLQQNPNHPPPPPLTPRALPAPED